jgi:hypothetical protein
MTAPKKRIVNEFPVRKRAWLYQPGSKIDAHDSEFRQHGAVHCGAWIGALWCRLPACRRQDVGATSHHADRRDAEICVNLSLDRPCSN